MFIPDFLSVLKLFRLLLLRQKSNFSQHLEIHF